MNANSCDRGPFRQGEIVVYPAHGVGRIDRVGPEEFSGHRLNAIRVWFADNQMTLVIPAARARAVGLRRLVPPEALDVVITTLQGYPQASRSMWAKRAQEYTAKINSGDVVSLSEVVRDLQHAPDGSGGSFSKRHLFELAMERLAGEFAAVSGTSKAAAVVRLTQTLQQAPRSGCLDAGRAERFSEST